MKFYSLLPLAFLVSLYMWTNNAYVNSSTVLCDVTADAGPDTAICLPGGTVNLNGSYIGQGVAWEWTPPQGLTNPNNLQTVANVTSEITYTLTVYGIDPSAPDLVTNGDFEQGNTAFTGDYTYVADDPLSQSEMQPEGTYTVVTNPNFVHSGFASCSDHTPGSGNMLVLNGAANLQDIWCQTITINPDTYYNFAAWVTSVNSASPAQLQFSINNVAIGSVFNASPSNCLWQSFNAVWNSGVNSTAEICILNLNTQPSGNDFAIDDISFFELCSVEDEVTISLIDEPAPEPIISGPDIVCVSETYEYTVTLPDSPAVISYTWSIAQGGTIQSGQGSALINVLWNTEGDREVCLEIETRCSSNSSCFPVTIDDGPATVVIFGPLEVCQNDVAIYFVTEDPLIESYNWQLPPGATLLSGENTELIEIQWNTDGFADLCLTVTNHCGESGTCVPVDIFPTHWVVIDTTLCVGNTFEVNGVTYGNGNNSGIEMTISQTGCDSTIEVIVEELDVLEVLRSITLCKGDSILLEGVFQSSNGIYTDSTSSSQGCDSVTITSLIIVEGDTNFITISTCKPAEAGTITETFDGDKCDSVVITETILLASDSLFILLASCNPADTGTIIEALLNNSGCDSIVTTSIRFAQQDSTFLTLYSCEPDDTGTTTQSFQNIFGCDSVVWTNTILKISDTILLTEIVCEIQDTGIEITNLFNALGCDSIVITDYRYGGSTPVFLMESSCEIQDTGITTQLYTNIFGCDSIVTTRTTLLPSITIAVDIFTCDTSEVGGFTEFILNQYGCYDTIITSIGLLDLSYCEVSYTLNVITRCASDPTYIGITMTDGTAPFDISWKYEDDVQIFNTSIDQLNELDSLLVEQEGRYTVIASWGIGMSDTSFIDVIFPDPLEVNIAVDRNYSGYALACFGDSNAIAELQILQSGTPPVTVDWSTGINDLNLSSLRAGFYSVTVTDAKGCAISDSMIIDQPQPLIFTTARADISCFGLNDGSISISSTSGGVSEISVWIGDLPSPMSFASDLNPGIYPILLIDQNGCSALDTVRLWEPEELVIALNPDTTIQYGSKYLIETYTNNVFKTISWTPNICDACTQVEVNPLATTTYTVEIQDSAGCIGRSSQTINVNLETHVYVPNVFSPNGDGINDYFFLSGNSAVVAIRDLKIFDRWGNVVHGSILSSPGVAEEGWDGRFRGSDSPAGVYVYVVQIEFIDGTSEFLKGDLTLIR